MFENHTIARIAGIPIRANLLLGYLLAFWAIMGASRGKAELTLTLIVLSMGLLLLHELGHALMARRFGLQVVDIVIWPLGGMARISDFPADPRTEAWVAAAGEGGCRTGGGRLGGNSKGAQEGGSAASAVETTAGDGGEEGGGGAGVGLT